MIYLVKNSFYSYMTSIYTHLKAFCGQHLRTPRPQTFNAFHYSLISKGIENYMASRHFSNFCLMVNFLIFSMIDLMHEKKLFLIY